jgi:hypothetical protein
MAPFLLTTRVTARDRLRADDKAVNELMEEQTMLKEKLLTMALASTFTVGMAAAQGYQYAQSKKEMTFSGIVESVNLTDHTFIVRNEENKNKVEEMKFHFPTSGARFIEETETVPIDELHKGDWVSVTWEPENVMHMVTSVQRHQGKTAEHSMPGQKPLTFTGKVESVNMKDQSFVVRNEDRGKVEELKFHVAPGTKLTLDGTPVLLSELQRDDQVTVSYQTVHMVKSVQRKAT